MKVNELKFNEDGLIPVIIQDDETGQVLMLAYSNADTVTLTIETGFVHFWSRSRQEVWKKGEESGNVQKVRHIYVDCDKDTLLITVEQTGVACHTGEQSCFHTQMDSTKQLSPVFTDSLINQIFNVIEQRKKNPEKGSYVSGLFSEGIDRILKKIGEEAGETIIAAKNESKKELIYEIADLWFHSLVLLSNSGLSIQDVNTELQRRFGKKKADYGLD